MNYTTKEIAQITHSQLIGDENLRIQHISFDSRNIYSAENTAFIAINTAQNSGEKYIQSAIEKGIKYVVSGPLIRSSYEASKAYESVIAMYYVNADFVLTENADEN